MKTTSNNNSETKKFYVIASTEYEANMPDLFVMDAEGNYYGVSGTSYVRWHNYPKSIDFWKSAEGSDAGRYFNIDEVELTQAQVDEFDRLTKEHERLDAEMPDFELKYPERKDYKTKKAYNQAVNDHVAAYEEWIKKNNIAYYINTKRDLWKQRTELFITFSQKVYEDIWRANGKRGWNYNHIYDIMHMAGVSIYKQRLCQPYGDDQRQGLYLFKILEPETWAKVVNRVEGANFGNRYTETDRTTLGNFKVNLPEGHTYESYAKFLLQTMPPYLAEHYQQKIDRFLSWWEKEGVSCIPDYADIKDEARKKVPSWRRICKVLLKNDYWCKGLSFSQTKKELEKQVAMITRYNEEL